MIIVRFGGWHAPQRTPQREGHDRGRLLSGLRRRMSEYCEELLVWPVERHQPLFVVAAASCSNLLRCQLTSLISEDIWGWRQLQSSKTALVRLRRLSLGRELASLAPIAPIRPMVSCQIDLLTFGASSHFGGPDEEGTETKKWRILVRSESVLSNSSWSLGCFKKQVLLAIEAGVHCDIGRD